MSNPTEIPVRHVWREHVLGAVDWASLEPDKSGDKFWFAGICLDLFVGGTVKHEPLEYRFLCGECPFAAKIEASPACELHLGIVEGFLEGVTHKRYVAERMVGAKKCMIHFRENG